MVERCEQEVVELHRFFEAWFNAEIPPGEESFGRFTAVMADGFVIVSPDGVLTERQALIDRLRDAYGAWRKTGRPGRIRIENLQVRHSGGQQALVVYEEWQEVDGKQRGRLSSALLRRNEATPNGVEWLHVHEVWLPE